MAKMKRTRETRKPLNMLPFQNPCFEVRVFLIIRVYESSRGTLSQYGMVNICSNDYRKQINCVCFPETIFDSKAASCSFFNCQSRMYSQSKSIKSYML